jgi:hypothetical protein
MSLQFTHENLKHWSHPTSYVRGEKYYQQGRVLDYSREDRISRAIVVGTALYPVAIDWLNTEASCPCLAFDKYWCKHLVALALTELDGVIVAKKAPKVKQVANAMSASKPIQWPIEQTIQPLLPQAIQVKLQQMTDVEKVQILEKILAQFTDVQKFFTRSLSKTYSAVELIKAVKKFVGAMKRSSYGDAFYRNKKEIEALLDEPLIWPLCREATISRLEIVEYIYQQFDVIDDSSGSLQAACWQLIDQAAAYVNVVGIEGLDAVSLFLQHENEDLVCLMLERLINAVDHADIQSWWKTELDRSNFQVLKSIALSREKLHQFFAELLAKSGHSAFLDMIVLCEKAEPLDHYYAEYYFQVQDWTNYLVYQSKLLPKFHTKQRLLQAYTALQDWRKVEEATITLLLERTLTTSSIRQYLPILTQALNQQYDAVQSEHCLKKYAEQFLAATSSDATAAELALMFYQPELAIHHVLTWWQKRYAPNQQFQWGATDEMPKIKILVERISLYSDEICIQLNAGLLQQEFKRLMETKSNSYDLMYVVIERLLTLGQIDLIKDFYKTMTQKMLTRKTAIQWIDQQLKIYSS